MKLELRFLNGLLLLLPLLAWNLALGPRLTLEAITSDAHSPNGRSWQKTSPASSSLPCRCSFH